MNPKLGQKQGSRKQGGFSLAEVMVGMGVVGITFISLYSGLTAGLTTVRMSRENVRATQIMSEKLDTIRLYSWDKIVKIGMGSATFTDTYIPSGSATNATGIVYTGQVTITPAPVHSDYQHNMRRVSVHVSWVTGSLPRERTMVTLIAKNGMQNYIY